MNLKFYKNIKKISQCQYNPNEKSSQIRDKGAR